ncbi:hypothetical protein [Streptomyces albipurpureus]|uniref:Uncharacterized protein n=1 Tax=Streptomyces albipurpureus TaxID=2897419 RepID=A0ABT0UL83_9ACTN|nr:hypothetical protein [Streptomyces sp. CWNU-1]MCM2389220.1 hypothetical protein [Streptomyces sp. CWNU-1]
MYEPIRTKSVHSTPVSDGYPHRSRDEELDIQLAGHLSALLAVTDELALKQPAEQIAAQITRLRGSAPVRRTDLGTGDAQALHRRAHALAGRVLVVAASRADTTVAILAAERMDAHSAALDAPRLVGAR